MASVNSVMLMGNLCADPELRYTPQGTPVGNFRMAINSQWKNAAGEVQKDVDYVAVVVWNRQAETVNEHLKKGAPVFVEGKLKFSSWETEGQKRSKLEVKAHRVQFLPQKPKEEVKPKEDISINMDM